MRVAREAALTVIFESDLVAAGTFRCRPSEPGFETAGQPQTNDFIAFPRTRVQIRHDRGGEFASDGFTVALHNRGATFRRRALSAEGDHCEWLALDRRLLLETVGEVDPWIQDRPTRPFRHTHAPTAAGTYLLQRQLFHHLSTAAAVDDLEVEERVVGLVHRLAEDAYGAWSARRTRVVAPGPSRQKDLVADARGILAERYRDPLRLGTVAGMLGVAHARLCRLFRHHAGLTLHAFREQLRHRHALEALESPAADLTDLALELGYSSHSHFTASFRRTFGLTPSEVRRRLSRGDGRVAAVLRARPRFR